MQDPVPVEPVRNNKCCQRGTIAPGGPPASQCYDGPCLEAIICSGSGTSPVTPAKCVVSDNRHCTSTPSADYPVTKYSCVASACPTNPALLTCVWVATGPGTFTTTGCSGSPCP